ncbi:MAG: type III-B CRISPR module-associated Cmr3 family protein [Polyangiales bacterium]
MSAVTGLRIDTLDVLFFRGSRPIGPNAAAESGLPHPQTLAGALRATLLEAHGFDLRAFANARRKPASEGLGARELLASLGAPQGVLDLRVRGPWLCRGERQRVETVFFAAPRTLYRDGDVLTRSWPARGGGAVGNFLRASVELQEGLSMPLWRHDAGDEVALSGLVTLDGLRRVLEGAVPQAREVVAPGALYGFDRRVGIGIDGATSTVKKGVLYAVSLLALCPGVGFYAEVEGDERAASALFERPFRFGGEGRKAMARRVDQLPGGGFARWSVPAKGDARAVITVTPGWDGDRAIPSKLGPAVRAASVARAALHSGFDVARGGPRNTRSLIPAGSVYFIEGMTETQGSFAAPDDAAAGEGLFVTGAWTR